MKKTFILIGILALVGFMMGLYIYNKPHKNMNRTSADINIEALELFQAYEGNEEAANQMYLDKVIQVQGTIRAIEKDETGQVNVTLDTGSDLFGIRCQMDELSDPANFSALKGEKITLKGICTGMLMDVVLVRCVKV